MKAAIATLGLRRDSVRLVPFCEHWSAAFAQERTRLARSLGPLASEIEHIGSTAIPDGVAKPILGIAVLASLKSDMGRLRDALITRGYIDRGDQGSGGGHLFVLESEPDVRTHHLHVIISGDPAWQNYLRFRDMLRSDRTLRNEYMDLKRVLAGMHSSARQRYADGESDFVARMLKLSGL